MPNTFYRRRSWVYDTVGHAPLVIDRLLDVRTTKWQKQLPTTMQCRSHSRRRTIECLWRPAAWTNTPKRTEKNLIVRSGMSEAETTNNKRLRSTFSTEAIQTRSIARPLCDSRTLCFLKVSFMLWVPLLSDETCKNETLHLTLTTVISLLAHYYIHDIYYCRILYK